MRPSFWLAFGLTVVACSSSSSTDEQESTPSGSQGGAPAGGQGGSSGKKPGTGGSSAGNGPTAGTQAGGESGSSPGAGSGGNEAGGAGDSGQGGQGGSNAGQGGLSGEAGSSSTGGAGGAAGESGASGSAGANPGPPPVRFVALGDTGEGSDDQKMIAAAMVKKCAESGCDFAILLGDNFYDDGVTSLGDSQWKTKFEDIYKELDIPFYAVLGNHDYGGNGAGYEPKNAQVQVDYAKTSTKWKMPDKHYHFTAGNSEFFALDTNEQMYMFAGDQKKTVASWISQSTATWKIALGHHPILSNGPHGNAGTYEGIPFVPIVSGGGVKDFMEEVICGKVDLYLCGHDHSRQYLKDTCKGTELVVSGAGAKVSKLNQNNASHFQALTTGFFYVRIEGDTLTSEFVDEAGQVEFTRVLTK